MRKTKFGLVFILAGMTVAGSAQAGGNACATIMCLGGFQLGGRGGPECKSSIQDYFDIVKKRHGDYDPDRTFKARQEYLDECKDGSDVDKARIQAKYGIMRRNPKNLF